VNDRGETFRYSPHFSTDPRVDKERCRASVAPSDGWGRSYQCQRYPRFSTEEEGGPLEWCKAHAPATLRAKKEAWEARYQVESKRSEMRHMAKMLAENVCDALLDPDRTQDAIDMAARRRRLLEELDAGG
jgi:hypothetical protein